MRLLSYFLICSSLFVSAHAETRIKISQHGAIADGKTLNTAAIQQAIDAYAQAGGGTVILTAGCYLSGTFSLRSDVNLHLEAGARLIGTSDLEQYRAPVPDGSPPALTVGRHLRALITGENLENIAITGPGTIDGNKVFNPHGEEKQRGPHTIFLKNCRKVRVSDLTIVDSANYAIYFSTSDDVEIRNANFVGGWDGVHWRGTPKQWCKNVKIIACQFATGDDSIAGMYWDQTEIKDCIINSSCNGIRLIGPATRLTISNNQFSGPGKQAHRTSGRTNMLGAIYLQPGGWDVTTGPLDDVLMQNNVMSHVASPVTVCVNPGNTVGKITVDGLRATGVYRAAMSVETWAETPIENVMLRDVRVEFAGGGTASPSAANVPPPKIDPRSLPVWGLYARNIRNLKLDNIRLTLKSADLRPMTKFDNIEQLQRQDFPDTN